ncbi:retinol dehydrogenase 7-like isoform X1 [Alligator mississippiensis]|uniref:retinol dehydrogenase 7-like isoform X1 n=1 Tax=Alligator mississippiensis TaxID=8496 RepID=UPI002877BAA0|nr:retinol dehydrogenase 7-like isoform X1 [Alligator mississippiensis]XP_059575312.1 retinol dehydrogenase 7-like isoform X1 [Alligator mississippiensis]XP_059575314.1 retinol dehydrogenase 7-like isoform X1 [Alligator mississippiensis]XP_059575315.1 retinol dehydrogenase 7-like isoform X1 [Alligator mississippiensis]
MWLYLAALLALYFLRRWHRERQMVGNLPDKHVFITGCDSGFGHLLAKQLDGRGLRVLAACLTEQGAERLQQATSGRLQTVILDVTCSDSIAAATAWVKGQVGDRGLWGLVNNAGIGVPTAPNEWLSKADFVRVLDVNLVGLIEVTLSLLPLVRRARGRVVNMASGAGRLSLTGGGYCPSKYGVEAFSDSLRRELHSFGVKVSIIEPGGFQTLLMSTQSLQEAWSRAPVEIKEVYGQQFFETNVEQAQKFLTWTSSNLHLVTDPMEHALTAQHPRTRYSCGWDAKLLYLPLSYLPTSWTDFIVSLAMHKPAQGI